MTVARRIIHVDMDAFYASVEQRDDPALRGRPVAVGGPASGRGVVAAASYEARAFGVRSAMPMGRALRLCPQLTVVRPDFARYRDASRRVMAILRSVTPLVEPLSLDEAYLDVTENALGLALARDVALAIKARIRAELGLTASAGVAPNKFLAKIASGFRKPDGLTVIAPERVEAFLRQLPVDALWGVGPVTAGKLRALGIKQLVDLRTADRGELARTLGSQAEGLLALARGDDPRPVVPHRATRSISAERTYPEDLRDPQAMQSALSELAARVATALERKRLVAGVVVLKLRYADFVTVTRQHRERQPTADAATLAARAAELLARTDAAHQPVRLLGVGAAALAAAAGSRTTAGFQLEVSGTA